MLNVENVLKTRGKRASQPNFKGKVEQLFSYGGISIDGNNPWDIQVHNNRFYSRLLTTGSLGLGESYMEGWWDCESLDQFFCRLLNAELDSKVKVYKEVFNILKSKLINYQKVSRAFDIGKHHYDIGNNLYQHMLDRRMLYSCGYWKNAGNCRSISACRITAA